MYTLSLIHRLPIPRLSSPRSDKMHIVVTEVMGAILIFCTLWWAKVKRESDELRKNLLAVIVLIVVGLAWVTGVWVPNWSAR